MKQITKIIAIFAALLLLAGCAVQTVEQVKNAENVGKNVAVRGTVTASIKIGGLSGYTLKDKNGDTIGVSTQNLPSEGDIVTARGILMKDTLLGYYIKAD